MEVTGSAWTVTESDSGPGRLTVTTASDHSAVVLDLSLSGESLASSTILDQVWIQTWLTGSKRADRCVYRLRTSESELRLRLPRGQGGSMSAAEVAVDNVRVAATQEEEQLVVSLDGTDGEVQSHVLEVWYQIEADADSSHWLSIQPATLDAVDHVNRCYWQLVLPRNEVVVWGDQAQFAALQWHGWAGWRRTALREQRDLETWIGTAHQEAIPASFNTYLFTSLGAPQQLTVRTGARSLILLTMSGSTLVVGLLLIYFPVLRHPATWLALGLLLVSAALLVPELALLAAQAACVGIILALLAHGLRHALFGSAQGHDRAGPGTVLGFEDRGPLHAAGWQFQGPHRHRLGSDAHAFGRVTFMTHLRDQLRHLWLACLAILTSLPAVASAQEGPAPGALDKPVHYRRIKVPQQDRDLFTSGYLPLLRSELPDRLLALDQQLRQSQVATAWVQAADYSASFVNHQLVNGQATLQVIQAGSEPAVLVLSPCQLALGAAVWREGEATREAVLGNDQSGRLLARVEKPGRLEFAWSLRGATNEWGETSFQVQLAPAPLNRLAVELPADYRLFTDQGMLSELAPATPSAQGGTRRWLIQLGGVHKFQLTVASASALRERQQQVGIQQNTFYRLADDGLELDCNIELEIAREPLSGAPAANRP